MFYRKAAEVAKGRQVKFKYWIPD
ncbi:MAG: hypothetical protein RLZZ214_1848, partial [Verrucomicrobiota bacterium]